MPPLSGSVTVYMIDLLSCDVEYPASFQHALCVSKYPKDTSLIYSELLQAKC